MQSIAEATASYFFAHFQGFTAGLLRFRGLRIKRKSQTKSEEKQACGMTQEEFCDKIGISDTHYRKIEAGSRTGSLELIVEMAEYFHVSLDYLLLGEMESNSKAKKDILAVIESLTKIAREL